MDFNIYTIVSLSERNNNGSGSLLPGKSSPQDRIHSGQTVTQLWSVWVGKSCLTRPVPSANGSLGQKTFSTLMDLQIFAVKNIKYL